MPALPFAAQLDSTREMWHKETSEQVRKRLSVLETCVCVHVLKASLTMAAHERGLVLPEQMASVSTFGEGNAPRLSAPLISVRPPLCLA